MLTVSHPHGKWNEGEEGRCSQGSADKAISISHLRSTPKRAPVHAILFSHMLSMQYSVNTICVQFFPFPSSPNTAGATSPQSPISPSPPPPPPSHPVQLNSSTPTQTHTRVTTGERFIAAQVTADATTASKHDTLPSSKFPVHNKCIPPCVHCTCDFNSVHVHTYAYTLGATQACPATHGGLPLPPLLPRLG